MTAVSDVYFNVVMNFDEGINISIKAPFNLTFIEYLVALILVGLFRDNPGLDPLDVLHLTTDYIFYLF